MKNRNNGNPDQVQTYDPETGEIENNLADELYGKEGPQPDGTVFLPKLTMATIRANPERAKIADKPMKIALITGIAGGEYLMPAVGDENRVMDLGPDHPEYMTFSALVAALDPWGCVRFDVSGEPGAVFKSDYLFLPTGHISVVQKRRQLGQVAIALELWAQPASNPRGYSWYYHNLAKYDRGLSPIDRMLMLGVSAGRQLADKRESIGLLADLRSR